MSLLLTRLFADCPVNDGDWCVPNKKHDFYILVWRPTQQSNNMLDNAIFESDIQICNMNREHSIYVYLSLEFFEFYLDVLWMRDVITHTNELKEGILGDM